MGHPDRHRRRSVLRSEAVSGVTTSGCVACTQPLLRPSAAGARRSYRPRLFRVPWQRHLLPFRGRSALWVRVVRPRPVPQCPALAPHRVLPGRRDIRQEHLGNHLVHLDNHLVHLVHLALLDHLVHPGNLEARHRRFLARVLQLHHHLPPPDSLAAHRHRVLQGNQRRALESHHQRRASENRHRELLGIQLLAWAIRHLPLAWESRWRGEGSSGHHPSASRRWELGIRSAPVRPRQRPRPTLPEVVRRLRSALRPQQLLRHPSSSSRSEPPVVPSWPQRARAENKHANPTNACRLPFANCIEIIRESDKCRQATGKGGDGPLPPFRDLCIVPSFL